MSSPTVSVVLPTYRRASMLKTAIESVISQTYSNWELIIIAGDPDTSTKEVLSSYSNDQRIKTIQNLERLGAAQGRNLGVKTATGEYIAFLDDDDEWLPEKLQLQTDYLERNPSCPLVSCYYFRCFKYGVVKIRFPLTVSANQLRYKNELGSFSFCMARSSLAKQIEIEERFSSCEDNAYWLRIVALGNCDAAVIPKYLVRYIDHGSERLTNSRAKAYRSYVRLTTSIWKSLNNRQKAYRLASMSSRKNALVTGNYRRKIKLSVQAVSLLVRSRYNLSLYEFLSLGVMPLMLHREAQLKRMFFGLSKVLCLKKN